MYSPFLSTARRDLEQSADSPWQLPRPAWPSLDLKVEKQRIEKKEWITVRNDNLTNPLSSPFSYTFSSPPAPCSAAASSSSPGFGGTARGPTLLPTFVMSKNSRIALVHRSSASRSRTVNRFLPLPVSFRTSAHRIFCCGFHCLQCLSRCSRVCVLY